MKRFDRNVAAVKRALRETYDRHPDAFEGVLAELLKAGDDRRKLLPPIVRGRDGKIIKADDEMQAWILIGYFVRPTRQTREAFGREFRLSIGKDYSEGTWTGATLLDYLRKAQSRAKRSAEFRGFVMKQAQRMRRQTPHLVMRVAQELRAIARREGGKAASFPP